MFGRVVCAVVRHQPLRSFSKCVFQRCAGTRLLFPSFQVTPSSRCACALFPALANYSFLYPPAARISCLLCRGFLARVLDTCPGIEIPPIARRFRVSHLDCLACSVCTLPVTAPFIPENPKQQRRISFARILEKQAPSSACCAHLHKVCRDTTYLLQQCPHHSAPYLTLPFTRCFA